MADPLSITASVVGVVVPALHATRLLLKDLQQLRDAPKTVKRLAEDVQPVEAALELLQSVETREWSLLGTEVAEKAETTISSSTRACNLFRADLQKWTRHSEDGKLAWQDRANVGFFKKDQVKAMSEQLQSCKLAISLIVSIANLYSSVHNTHLTEDMKKTIAVKQDEVKSAMTTADKRLVVLENKVEEMNLSDDDEEVASTADGKTEALRQFEEELRGVKESQKLLYGLLSKAQEGAIAKASANQIGSTTVTFGYHNSGFQAGIVNGGVTRTSFGGK